MKKERKLKLEVSRVSVSKLNHIIGSGPKISIELCALTTQCDTNIDGDCKTYITVLGTVDGC
ncbi:hypothetical protein H2O64_15130 [Kordia sp. YSTF-M3]|uniref:Bacteriocin n=1 Tax=Kordia aestuariivivens TaxID=2759037 RepID=A0ABR7QBS9_9FLAO|nr:hypothetical protein [Kordia aestuariivivens]MBC8756009.1 hypothetical protein [Kordia aestuariivivens]